MAMKRVVRDCLWGARREGEDDTDCDNEEASVDWGIEEGGVEKREWSCEEVDGVGRGEERADGERIAVESCGDVEFRGFETEI